MVRLNNIFKYKQVVKVLTLMLVILLNKSWGQVLITTTSYTQNFGATNITSWTNNSTFLGWYINPIADFVGYANIGASANSYNTGGFYTYNCGSDAKIGSRGSGSATNLRYGVVLRNTTGQTIFSVRVTYDGFQMTLAENGSNVNTIAFDYSVATTAPPITGAGTAVAALNFSQLQNSTINGSNQINWYPCTQSVTKTACIPVTIANNSYILLRWRDIDDPANDHHMAIDNVKVDFGLVVNDCSVILPIELIDFYATKNNITNDVVWKVAAEDNIDYYVIEKSNNGVDFFELDRILFNEMEVNNFSSNTYSIKDNNPFDDITYYRLVTRERNGTLKYYRIISIDESSSEWKSNCYQRDQELILEFKNSIPKNSSVSLFDLSGKLLVDESINGSQININTQNFSEGIYFIKISSAYKTENFKIIIQK